MVSKYLYSGETLNESLTKLRGKYKTCTNHQNRFFKFTNQSTFNILCRVSFFAHWHLGRNLNWKTKWNKYTKENDQFNKGLN